MRPSKALFRLKLGRIAMDFAVLGLASLALTAPSDRRLALHNAGVVHPEELRSALHLAPCPAGAPPEHCDAAFLAAGRDRGWPPVLASDMAPLPFREDAAIASIVRKTALQRVAPETTLAAQANPRTAAQTPD